MRSTFSTPLRALAFAATVASLCQGRLTVRRTSMGEHGGLVARGQHDTTESTAPETYGGGSTKQLTKPANANQKCFLDHTYDSGYVGYFFIFFKDDTEQINAGLSKDNDPLSYDYYNNGGPVLVSNVGSKHTRDPSLVRGFEQNYIIATDNSLKAINYNFTYANAYSSRKITVFESDGPTLAKWKPARVTKDLVGTWSGGVSGPEAIWDPDTEDYLVTFSSNVFSDKDPKHLEKPGNTSIYAVHTSDFITFTEPQLYYGIKGGGLTDMVIKNVAQYTYVRFFRDDTNGVLKVRGQISHDGIHGKWEDIGTDKDYVSDDGANGGPLLFRDNKSKTLWHIWVDEFQGGYKPYETNDVTKPGYTLSKAPNFPKDLKQGSVTPVEQSEYDELKAAQFPTSS